MALATRRAFRAFVGKAFELPLPGMPIRRNVAGMAVCLIGICVAATAVGSLWWLLLPIGAFGGYDLAVRLLWRPPYPRVFPPPPSLTDRLLHGDFGFGWFPMVLVIPIWLISVGILGLAVYAGRSM